MKNKHQLLKSFFLFSLLFVLSTPSFASEVLGTLSSGGGNTGGTASGQQQSTTTGDHSSSPGIDVTPDNGTLAGNVTGDTKTTSGGNGNGNGSSAVLGESTMDANLAPTTTSSDGLSLDPSQSTSTVEYGTGVSEINTIPQANDELFGSSAQTATVLGAFSQISAANWFWIILLTLLLIAVITYIYNHNKIPVRTTKLHF